MNLLATLSDYPILHICTFLPGKDLLTLTEVDHNFNRIITKSKETMAKIRFVLDFSKFADLDDVIEAARNRRFIALKVANAVNYIRRLDKFYLLLDLLKNSVEDLFIEDVVLEKYQLCNIIHMLLPRLKTCTLNNIRYANFSENIETFSYEGTAAHRLEALKLENSAGEIVELFESCSELKTFEFKRFRESPKDLVALNGFLAGQAHLRKLTFAVRIVEWNSFTCFQLEELTTSYSAGYDMSSSAISEFLKKLPNLKTLRLKLYHCLPRRIMRAICNAPKLQNLDIQIWRGWDIQGNSLEGLANDTVKKLRIEDGSTVAGCLLRMFRGVEAVVINLRTESSVLELTGVPFKTISKIKLEKCSDFFVTFSPLNVPEDVATFESEALRIARKLSANIYGITIGHENWRNDSDLSLSNEFCERLVSSLPRLSHLNLFNVAASGRFYWFLDANRKDLKHLEEVTFNKPKTNEDPEAEQWEIKIIRL